MPRSPFTTRSRPFTQTTITAADGTFRFTNIPQNPYHVEISAAGFETFARDVAVRSAVAIQFKATLAVAGSNTSVTVEATGADLLEAPPLRARRCGPHAILDKIPALDPGAGLSQAIVYSTGGVAADANGFFHPLGDHAQVSFVVDGQPISDQQSKVFSTQLPTNAIQGMELITGAPTPSSATRPAWSPRSPPAAGSARREGVRQRRSRIRLVRHRARATPSLGFGSAKIGNFLALDGTRTGRFLDSPEFTPFHDIGNNQTIFDRIDLQPNGRTRFT